MALLPQPRVEPYPKDPYNRPRVNNLTLNLDRGLEIKTLPPREMHKLVFLWRKPCSVPPRLLYILSVDLLEAPAVILGRIPVRYKVHVVYKAYR